MVAPPGLFLLAGRNNPAGSTLELLKQLLSGIVNPGKPAQTSDREMGDLRHEPHYDHDQQRARTQIVR